jgi:hypothetical protein
VNENKVGSAILPDLNLYYKVIVIKTLWYKTETQTHGTEWRNQK